MGHVEALQPGHLAAPPPQAFVHASPTCVLAPIQAMNHNHLSAPGACKLTQLPAAAFGTTLLDPGRSADWQGRASARACWQRCVQISK